MTSAAHHETRHDCGSFAPVAAWKATQQDEEWFHEHCADQRKRSIGETTFFLKSFSFKTYYWWWPISQSNYACFTYLLWDNNCCYYSLWNDKISVTWKKIELKEKRLLVWIYYYYYYYYTQYSSSMYLYIMIILVGWIFFYILLCFGCLPACLSWPAE